MQWGTNPVLWDTTTSFLSSFFFCDAHGGWWCTAITQHNGATQTGVLGQEELLVGFCLGANMGLAVPYLLTNKSEEGKRGRNAEKSNKWRLKLLCRWESWFEPKFAELLLGGTQKWSSLERCFYWGWRFALCSDSSSISTQAIKQKQQLQLCFCEFQ